jgi:cobyrinic acid a,c-diamide synthase
MFGLIPGRSQMRERLTMGYRQITARRDTLLLKQGEQARKHEFHYSDWIDGGELPHAYDIAPRQGEVARPEGFAAGNLLASYVHLHFAANPAIASNFVEACKDYERDVR